MDDRLTVEMIVDGIHLHPEIVKLMLRIKPKDRVVAISDSIGAAGLPDGTYHFEEQEIIIANHSARLRDGTLAGSVTSMEKELINLVHFGGISLNHALQVASLNPATEIGFGNRKGSLTPGKDADIICLDRQTLNLEWSMVKGRQFFL
jgi:N-acetylglucosamine-6-phosphate deacetylase